MKIWRISRRSRSLPSTACARVAASSSPLSCDLVSRRDGRAGACRRSLGHHSRVGRHGARLAKFAGRRKAKEWNLTGALFSAEKAERYDHSVNRLCEPDELESEVSRLIEVLLAKSSTTLRCTKYFLDNGADLDLARSMIFEGAPPRQPFGQGIRKTRHQGYARSTSEARARLLVRLTSPCLGSPVRPR